MRRMVAVKDLAPVHEALVAGNGEAGSLVAADQEQEEAGLLAPEGEIAERVEDEDPGSCWRVRSSRFHHPEHV
jgi:hypothetical protein